MKLYRFAAVSTALIYLFTSALRVENVNTSPEPRLLTRQAETPPLRILPLGASIMYGMGSKSGNGLRKPLRDTLREQGFQVDMVGSKKCGGADFDDQECQANPGDTVNDVRAASEKSLIYKPNVVIINAGTNDCSRNIEVDKVGQRMRGLIENYIQKDGRKNKIVFILSTLTKNRDSDTCRSRTSNDPKLKGLNQQYRELVLAMQREGKMVELADMDPPAGQPGHDHISHSKGDFSDATHPNDQGMQKMAKIFFDAILRARDKGWLKPLDPLSQADQKCEENFYQHASQQMPSQWSVVSENDIGQWFFARLYAKERDDLVEWYNSNGQVGYRVWRSQGGGKFDQPSEINVEDKCSQNGAVFADVDADGLEDILCIRENGDVTVSFNRGGGRFESIGNWKSNEDHPRKNVRIGDVDGDGRADYCIIEDKGDIYCWRNRSEEGGRQGWQSVGKLFTAKGMGDIRGVRFEDINGDRRDDWLWVSDTGQTTTWTNVRPCAGSEEGNSNIAWRQGFGRGKNSGPTHGGMNVPGIRNRVHFARIFGEPAYPGGLPKLDYVYMQHESAAGGKHKFTMKIWKNLGGGGHSPA